MTADALHQPANHGALTFAVPAYGESPHLEACLRSLAGQSVPAHVLLATSTPSVFLSDMAARFGYPIAVNDRRQGIASDWSFAYRSASTPYVTLAHQDDVYAPDYSAKCLAAAARHPDSLLVFTDAAELLEGGCRLQSRTLTVKLALLRLFFARSEAVRRRGTKKRLLSLGNPISCPTVLFNRGNIGEFAFSSEWSYNLDWDAWQRLAAREGAFVYVRQPLVAHRIHEGSALVKGTNDQSRAAEDRRMFARFWPGPMARLLSGLYAMSYSVSRTNGK